MGSVFLCSPRGGHSPIPKLTRANAEYRPTIKPLEEVVEAFHKLSKPLTNNSELNEFLSTYGSPAQYWRYVAFFTILGVIVVFAFKTVLSAFRFIWPYLLGAHIVAFAVFYHESLDKNKSGYHV